MSAGCPIGPAALAIFTVLLTRRCAFGTLSMEKDARVIATLAADAVGMARVLEEACAAEAEAGSAEEQQP